MTTSEEYKEQGNEAYKAGKVDEAIALYTQGIEADESNHLCWSNRSAAYLQKGDGFHALHDADKCLELDPTFVKGYSRKAAALHFLKRYTDAIAVLKEALNKFPGEEHLQKELDDCLHDQKAIRMEKGRRASLVASVSSQHKAAEADTMSDFVKLSRATLEFEIAAKQAQLEILNSLAKRSDEDKLKLLFNMLDTDGDGLLSARELSDGIRKNNADFSFADSLDRAIDMVAVFDQDKDAKLNPDEFKKYVDTMLEAMGVSFHEFSEFLIMQMLFTEGNDVIEELVGVVAEPIIDEEVKARGDFYDALLDQRMAALFQLFDLDHDGQVDFMEVALGLHQLTGDMESSAEAAIGVLLMFDKDESRSLDYVQFSRLVMDIAATSGQRFEDIADNLTIAMCKDQQIGADDIASLVVTDALFNAALDEAEAEKEALEAIGSLQYAKLHKLFDLWDTNKDGFINFDELVTGMRRFQEAMDIDESIQRAALVMLGFDADGNQKLDRIEFALALNSYAKSVELDVHDLVDFMVVSSVMADDDEFEQAYVKAIAPSMTKEIKGVQEEMGLIG